MSKHTPGPWRVIKKPQKVGYAEFEIAWSDAGELVCDIVYEESDAHLIAAAPELLEALIKCASVCAGNTNHKSGLIDALESARAAIAKATGA